MDRSKYNIFRHRNQRDRARDQKSIHENARTAWNDAVRDEDDDELRRLTAEHGLEIYGTLSVHMAFQEAEEELVNELDDEEVEFDEEDSAEAGGRKWIRHTGRDFDWDMFPEGDK